MICCYIMLVHVVRNCLVLILLKSVPSLISYDVICIETSSAYNYASLSLDGEQLVHIRRP